MASNRQQVVKLAQTFVGCKQGDSRHKQLVDTFNSVRPHGEVGNYSCAWCAITWTALQIMAGNGQEIAPYSYNCGTLITYAKKIGVWVESDAYVPSPGDGIIYYWSDSGKGDCTYGASHVGVVETVSGGKITVIEGNKGTSRACARRTLNINGQYIRGFITPKYSDGKSTYDYTLDVDGDWGFLTTLTTQHILGCDEDGELGKKTWKAIQKKIGLSGKDVDGIPGPITFRAMQNFLNALGYTDKKGKKLTVDGELGVCTTAAWQKWCNAQVKKTTTETTEKTETTQTAEKVEIKGMDISTWQGDLSVADFKKAIDYGIKFAILRVGFTGKDSKKCTLDNVFDNNYPNAIKAGLPVGIYYYSLATTEAKAREEAEWVVNKLKGLKITYPVYIDMEDNNYQAKCSKATLAAVCNAFCKVISDAGYTAGVYANLNWWNNKIGDVDSKYEKWVAQYYTECQYKGNYSIWQYSSSESVPGIDSKTDVNICYKNFDKTVVIEDKTSGQVEKVASTYTGTLPSIRVKKTSQQVIDDTLKWGKMIANDNRFHYGEGGRTSTKEKHPVQYDITHRCGCYMCNTNYKKKVVPANKAGFTGSNWQKTYVCNPFVNACYAHGGQVKKLLDLCKAGKSLGMNTKGQCPTLHNSSEWQNLGQIATSKMNPGDVLISTGHAQIYYGKSSTKKAKILEATSYEGKMGCKASDSSIRIIDKNPSYTNVYRYIGTIDRDIPVAFGEYSDRVKQIQDFLQWAGFLEDDGTPNDGIWMDNTEKCVNAFCQAVGLVEKGNTDRIQWGAKCNEKAKAYKK